MQFTDEWLVPSVASLLTDEQLATVRSFGTDQQISLWEALVQRKLLTDEAILSAVARRFHLPVADLSQLDPSIREEVPESLVRKFVILPIRIHEHQLEIATANPFDIDAEKMLAFATGREVRTMLCSPNRIREKLDELYIREDVVSKLLAGMGTDSEVTAVVEEDEEEVSAEEAAQRPIIRLVDTMLADGVMSRASDIHVEPVEGGVVVRYRIDGVLRQVMKIPRAAGIPLISRIKIMGGMDIADRLRPQDGRARVAVNGNPVDLRISSLPATLGEKVVIRILNTKATVLQLASLGFSADDRETMARMLRSKEGVILVTGPTGSGKTTTLYACLQEIQHEGVNIVTVEDPVEYRLGQNIVQVQVNEKAGLTFSSALRSILRQDPDVVLVGEIRDKETSQIAVQAALTGHLVLSTLHTNDAPSTVTRLLDMGLEAYKISAALRGVIAQRLLRRLCPVCKEVSDLPIPAHVQSFIPAGTLLYKPTGCKECTQTGYRGRFAIVELLSMTIELEGLIGGMATSDRIGRAARAGGMRSLFESGLDHVLQGNSAIEELLRVTDIPPELDSRRAFHSASGPTAAAPVAVPPVAASPVAAPIVVIPQPSPKPAPPTAESLAFDLIDDLGTTSGEDQRGCVLLVEDEDHLRRVMKDLLEREGYRIVEAADGITALEMLDRHSPDVMLLDLNLPGLDGYSVLAQVRSRPSTAELPVIVLTAKGDEDNEVRVLRLGANDFLTKPFRARALSARLEAVLGRRRSPE